MNLLFRDSQDCNKFSMCIDAITFRGNIYFESEFNEWFRPDLSSLSITTS
jgi:hypothetical protein